jgi:hypothetical protein
MKLTRGSMDGQVSRMEAREMRIKFKSGSLN